jgi:hypothetical protein
MNQTLIDAIEREIAEAEQLESSGEIRLAFQHLERAHVLGQASTYEHTRVHWRMLGLALRLKSIREIWGQIIRIIGASTKTPFGIYPTGNTGGADVWFFQRMTIPKDLKKILDR